jgi:hypothetical protein
MTRQTDAGGHVVAGGPHAAPRRGFDPQERRLLMRMPRIGEGMVERLEAAGYTSLKALHEAGTARVLDRVAAQVGQGAWLNRRRALDAAIQRLVVAAGDRPEPPEVSN